MKLDGQVVEIRYKNELNSYCIADFNTEDGEITIVGYLPFVVEGDRLIIEGQLVEHKEYGEQIKIETFEKQMPKGIDGLEKYLANSKIPGVGPATAKKIIDMFGEETIKVFKLEPHRLSKIKGINNEKAKSIAEAFLEKWEEWQLVTYLTKFGIGPQNIERISKQFGENAISKIEENPYILLDVGYRVNFKQIDDTAINNGVSLTNEKRIRSGIKYSIMAATLNGHTTVLKDNLIEYCKELLNIDIKEIQNQVINMIMLKDIFVEERHRDEEKQEWIYLNIYHNNEEKIAKSLIGLKNAKNIKKVKDINSELLNYEKIENIELTSEQKKAVKSIAKNNVCVITGGPGTGKTTIIKAMLHIYNKKENKVVLCAPTGRAAKRMSETTGEEAKTLHRLLEIGNTEAKESNGEQHLVDVAPIDADVIIVDEISMVDTFLMSYLLKAIYKGTKLVLVGDVDQLPSVGAGNVLEDIILSETITTVKLNKIFRQAAQSKIIVNSHRVNEGKFFISKEEIEKEEQKYNEDFFFINENRKDELIQNISSLSSGRLKKFGNFDFAKSIQIITPTKKGDTGTKGLNQILQNVVNPNDTLANKQERKFGDIVFREGDRVMQTKNNYEINWEKYTDKKELGKGIFNGEFGIIEKINQMQKDIKIRFDDDKVAWYEFENIEQLEHAFAITVHKSQGSEFDVVIMPIGNVAPMLLTRNLLYTAMTRAKSLLIVIGSRNQLEFMINNNKIKKRNTGLKEKLIKINIDSGE